MALSLGCHQKVFKERGKVINCTFKSSCRRTVGKKEDRKHRDLFRGPGGLDHGGEGRERKVLEPRDPAAF